MHSDNPVFPANVPQAIVCGGLSYAWHEGCFLTRNAAEYALGRLWELTAGDSGWESHFAITIPAMTHDQVEIMLNHPPGALAWIDLEAVLPAGSNIGLDTPRLPAIGQCGMPMHFDGQGPFPLDLVSALFIQFTCWQEWKRPCRDQYGCQDETVSLAAQQGFRERPLLDEWALVLRSWLKHTQPSWCAKPPAFEYLLSHDIDSVQYYKSLWYVFRAPLYQLVYRRSIQNFIRSCITGCEWILNSKNDPKQRAFFELLNSDERLGQRGVYYMMAATPSAIDNGYQLDRPPATELWQAARQRGHSLGWHISHRAAHSKDAWQAEWERISSVFSSPPTRARHHYLAWQGPQSWRQMDEKGVLIDSSLGYNYCLGFRCSTATPFPVYDIERDRKLILKEYPLIIQDGGVAIETESKGIQETNRLVWNIIRRAKHVGGKLTVLLHNNGFPTEKALYSLLLNDLGKA